MKNLLIALLLAPVVALAAEGGYRLDHSPHDQHDIVSLQSGARTYMNYCLGCHGMQFMRYDGLKHLEKGSPADLKDRAAPKELIDAVNRTGEFMAWQKKFMR